MSSPSPMPQMDSSPDERVTTEPQRQALDTMSQELVNKLNVMVAEQEQRAREFAARQHSLSSLPQQTEPSGNLFSPEALSDAALAAQQVKSAPLPQAVAWENRPSSGRTAPPQPPPVRSPLTGSTLTTGKGNASGFPPPNGSFPSREPEEEKGVSINAGTLIVILLIGLVVLRSCGA